MLRRQKILLGLVAYSGRSVNATMLMKLAFLARHETHLRSDHTFYDFVPYKYGPFSFALYRELTGLTRNGYLAHSGDRIVIPRASRQMAQRKIDELPNNTLIEVNELATGHSSLPTEKLLRKVYAEYPWYAARSERKDLQPPRLPRLRTAPPAVYTIGYEGRSIDSFFRELLRRGVKTILDVRANPVSRKYGFAKSSFSQIADKLEIEYQHKPQLGIPSSLRKPLSDYASYQRLFTQYKKTIARDHRVEVATVAARMNQRPTALMCMEKDVKFCHRSRLAEAISAENGLDIKNL